MSSVIALAIAACSSVPEVTYEDLANDAAADGGGSGDARGDGAPTVYACPGNPPPAGSCCAKTMCANCGGPNDCDRCDTECPGKVCCKVPGNKVTCVASVASCAP